MTKQTKPEAAILTTDLPLVVEAVPVPTVQARPFSMVLTGTMLPTLHKLVAAARQGYIAVDIQTFGHTGQISVTLELGNPDVSFVEAVHADMADAVERERIQNEKAIEDAAIRLIAERERTAKQAAIAAEIADAEKTLRALKRQAVAAA
jgi:hypothetical protein